MADPADWSTRAAVEDPALQSFEVNPDIRDDATDTAKQNMREVFSADFEWAGVTQACMRFLVMTYRAATCLINTAAESGIALLTDGAPVTSASSFAVKNFLEIGATIYEGWHLMILDTLPGSESIDPTIYRLTADATVAGVTATDLTVTTGTVLRGIDSDNTNNKLYWTGRVSTIDYIYNCDQDGTNKATIATLSGISFSLALDVSGNRIYYSDRTNIKYCDLDGTNPGTLITKTYSPRAMAVSGSYLYYQHYASIRRITIPGGTGDVEILPVPGLYWINAIVASGSYLYYTATDGYIYRCDAADGGNVTQVFDTGNADAYGLQIADGYFYYCAWAGTKTVYRIPTTGLGNAVALNADTNPAWIAGDFANDKLYVLSDDATIYELDLSAAGTATLSVSPNITAGANALGSDVPVYFFKPTGVSATRSAGDGSMYTVTVNTEFKTNYQDIDQPEES